MLTAAWTKLLPHRHQAQLMRSTAQFVAVAAGRGSGKSDVSRRRLVWALQELKPWSDPEYFYSAPTTDQARRLGWEKLKLLVPRAWIRKANDSSMVMRTVFGSTLRVFGLDKPMRAEGLQYDGGVIDESSDVKPKTFDLTFVPALSHRQGWCWRIGVPKRFGIGAREFKAFFQHCRANHGDGVHEAYHWKTSSIPKPELQAILESRRRSLDDRDYAEQFDASWESVSGAVYYGYDPAESYVADAHWNADAPLMVGSDFNVDPMAWVIIQANGKELHVIDEVFLRNTNTPRTLDVLWERYHEHRGGWYFFGDASSRQRHASAVRSDYEHIRNDIRFKDVKIIYPKSNPAIHDRTASVNWAMKAADGTRTLKFGPKCVNLRAELEYLAYKPGTRAIDNQNGTVGHITDGLGYVIHRIRPARVDHNVSSQVGVV